MNYRFQDKAHFLFEFAKQLHQSGSPAHSLEATMRNLGESLNLKTTFVSIPTAIFCTIEEGDSYRSKIIRVEPQGTQLGRLSQVDAIATEVIYRRMSLNEGLEKLEQIEHEKGYSPWLILMSHLLLSIGMITLFGGSWGDLLAGILIGIVVGLIALFKPFGLVSQMMEVLVAFVVTLLAYLLSQFSSDLNPMTIILGGLIVLLPGLNITIAIAEIATQNLTSGTSRLMWGLMILLKLTFGVYLGKLLAQNIHIRGVEIEFGLISDWFIYLAVPMTAWASTYALKALKSDAWLVMLAGCFGFITSKVASLYLGTEASLFFGGLIVGGAANLYARHFHRPSSLFQLPGIILLVPGSIGYKGLSFFFEQDTVGGIHYLFTMVTLAFALVMGIFVGNILIKPRGMTNS